MIVLLKHNLSGHDAYQNSVVNAKDSNSFKLTCAAINSNCKDITIWCPQKTGTIANVVDVLAVK